jgi:hypothetical protein
LGIVSCRLGNPTWLPADDARAVDAALNPTMLAVFNLRAP